MQPDSPKHTATRSSVLLNLSDAAFRLSISRRTLQTLIANGKIPFVRVSPRRIAIDPVDLDSYIDQQRR